MEPEFLRSIYNICIAYMSIKKQVKTHKTKKNGTSLYQSAKGSIYGTANGSNRINKNQNVKPEASLNYENDYLAAEKRVINHFIEDKKTRHNTSDWNREVKLEREANRNFKPKSLKRKNLTNAETNLNAKLNNDSKRRKREIFYNRR